MFQEELKIPKERIQVLIGKKGLTKRKIEKLTDTDLEIDSKEGDVFISGEESLKVYLTKNIILAIARGFNPEIALELLKENYCLEIVEIKDYGKSKQKIITIKSRIIGTKGKCRDLIESLTNTHLSTYGKTVGIIGKVEGVMLAKRAVEMILKGSKHGNVYAWLEKQKINL